MANRRRRHDVFRERFLVDSVLAAHRTNIVERRLFTLKQCIGWTWLGAFEPDVLDALGRNVG
jgi:hypothetical protein